MLKANRVITSSVTGHRFRIGDVLGEGGFGRTYRAEEIDRRGRVTGVVCLKTTFDQASWHRESYFGELFRHSRRVIQLLDSFPLPQTSGGQHRILYCLVLELAEGGNIADYLERTSKPWSEARAKREIAALLKTLDQLHAGGATHRDLTPMNVFVCGRGVLKLGDFGIARHQVGGKLITIDAFNPQFVSRGFVAQEHRRWLAADDVFQMGQLLAMLLRGDASERITLSTLKQIDISDKTVAVIRRAIGTRSKRYGDAYEMLQELEGRGEEAVPAIRSLQGKTVAFSGALSIRRFDAEIMVLQAGGTVAHAISRKIDVLVQGGGRSPRSPGALNSKLRQTKRLIEQGQPICVIGEREFRQLIRANKR
ncbi:serine/threonine protein kinase [Haliangium ochraceum DSM 14365]|uniref:Serine/threonine protein kinase n=2 Tax=Haliangium ochraceum TaxID=80816 RepID=D0LYB3_HALO1|nr:serine/threonine protein kinase [Haliangium ochraceum DSM 14365]